MDLSRAEKELRRKGAFYDPTSKVGVKIVSHFSGDGFAVETTVEGDRRLPVEDPMPLEEALRLALAQLVNPRGHYEYTPSKNDHRPAPKSTSIPYRAPSSLVMEYKRKGLGRQVAWNKFVCDTIHQPTCRSEGIDSDEFFHLYDSY